MIKNEEIIIFLTGYSSWKDWWTMQKFYYRTFYPKFYTCCQIVWLKCSIIYYKILSFLDK